ASDSLTDSFLAVSSDGTASQLVDRKSDGKGDSAVIGGVSTGKETEDVSVVSTHISTSGLLTIADADQGQSNFTAQAATAGSNNYGSFTLLADGHWSYTADNSQTAIQQLGASDSLTDSFLAVSSDGTASQLGSVTITSAIHTRSDVGVWPVHVKKDVSVVSTHISTSGLLTIADADQGHSNFFAQAPPPPPRTTLFPYTTLFRSWSYTADNSQTAIQQLGASDSLTDSFLAVSSDGTASQL